MIKHSYVVDESHDIGLTFFLNNIVFLLHPIFLTSVLRTGYGIHRI